MVPRLTLLSMATKSTLVLLSWACMALTLYGKKLCRKLCAFIVENAINDLHTSNIGYNHNKPIILDFSGYDRKY